MDWWTTQRDELRDLLRHFFGGPLARALLALARPAVRIGRADLETGTPLKNTRLGGAPLLPPGAPWPRWDGRALGYLGIVDFAEIAEVMAGPGQGTPGTADGPAAGAGPPVRGAAGFFYAAEAPRPWGDDPAQADGWRVVTDSGGELAGAAPPPEVTGCPELALCGSAFLSLPGPLEPALRGVADRAPGRYEQFRYVYREVYEAWAAYVWPGGRPRHQVGGWPVLVQRPLWPDCARAAAGLAPEDPVPGGAAGSTYGWRLLLQLDSDDRLGWYWGDTGRVYFAVRDADAAVGALERSWLTLQSR